MWPEMWLTTFNGDPNTPLGKQRLASFHRMAENVLVEGCKAIPSMNLPRGQPFQGSSVCQSWNMLISSVANLCPETCGCSNPEFFADPWSGCPRSCQRAAVPNISVLA